VLVCLTRLNSELIWGFKMPLINIGSCSFLPAQRITKSLISTESIA